MAKNCQQQSTVRVVRDVGSPPVRAARTVGLTGSLSERTARSGADVRRRLGSPAEDVTRSEVTHCSSSGRMACAELGNAGARDSSPVCDTAMRGSSSGCDVGSASVLLGRRSRAGRSTGDLAMCGVFQLLSAAENWHKQSTMWGSACAIGAHGLSPVRQVHSGVMSAFRCRVAKVAWSATRVSHDGKRTSVGGMRTVLLFTAKQQSTVLVLVYGIGRHKASSVRGVRTRGSSSASAERSGADVG